MARIFLSPPDVGKAERERLLQAFDSNWIAPLGPEVDAFEAEFAREVGAVHAVALASGTAALHLALILLGVGPGQKVIVPTLTFAATANAVRYTGAEPVFVDSDPTTWNLSPGLLVEALASLAERGERPAAVISVDLYGQCADHDRILEACARWEVPVVEDAAEALGATYKNRSAGVFGAFGAFSFNGNKIITTSGGGMLVTERKEWADRARFLASQARDPAPHYQHSVIGYNYRLSNLLAAVGRAQLESLKARVAKRRALFEKYREQLGTLEGWSFQQEAGYGRATRWLTCAQIDASTFGATPLDICRHLDSVDVEARPVWKPLHLQPVFSACQRFGGSVAENLFARGLCLPSGSGLSGTDHERVIDGIRSTPRRAERAASH